MLGAAYWQGMLDLHSLFYWSIIWLPLLYISFKYKVAKYYVTWVVWWLELIFNFYTITQREYVLMRHVNIGLKYLGTLLYHKGVVDYVHETAYLPLNVLNTAGLLLLLPFYLQISLM